MLRLAALLLVLACAGTASAQTFERFGVREGMLSESIYVIHQDRTGYLWIGTIGGLSRYDGHRFLHYELVPSDPTSLPGTQVRDLVEDAAGGIWVSTERGIARLDVGTGQFHRVPLGPGPTVNTGEIEIDRSGALWISATTGLYRHDPESGESTHVLESRDVGILRGIHVARDAVWAESASAGLLRVALDDGRVLQRYRTDRDGTRVPRILDQMDESEPWFVDETQKPVTVMRFEQGRFVPQEVLPRESVLRVMTRMSGGETWFGGQTGVYIAQADGTTRRIEPRPGSRGGLGGFDARAMERDAQGSLWIGTESGLYLWRAPTPGIRTYRHDPRDPTTLSDSRVNGIAESAPGELVVATNNGLNRLTLSTGLVERLSVTTAGNSNALLARAFWQVYRDPADRVWVSAKSGPVQRLLGDRLEAPIWMIDVEGQKAPLGWSARTLRMDAEGRLWSGSAGTLLVGPPGGQTERHGGMARHPGSSVFNVTYEDQRGTVWLGTDGGLFKMEPDGMVPVASKGTGALCGEIIWSMTESPADPGALWVALISGGLARLDLDSEIAVCITTADGLPSGTVYGVEADDRGGIWASTSAGLARVDVESWDIAVYTHADGLQGDAFDFMAHTRLSDGRVAFGGPQGLSVIDPAVLARTAAPARVAITGTSLYGEPLPGTLADGDTLAYSHDANFFGFTFSAFDFRSPERVRYRYRLVGLDGEWREADGVDPRAVYTDVPPGQYRFEVSAASNGGEFLGEPTVVVVRVVPAFWQTWWARSALLLALVGFAFLGARANLRRRVFALERRRAEQAEVQQRLAEGRERERARLARDLHDGPVQGLYRIGHDLDALARDANGQAEEVRGVRGHVGDVAGELREMLTQLRPTLARHLSLPDALDSLAGRFAERYAHIDVETDWQTEATEADDDVRLALYRIAQESLENVAKHAEASRVSLALLADGEGLRLVVTDDGGGFVVPERLVAFARESHYGLVGMQERAGGVGGHLTIRSGRDAGTQVEAWVPNTARVHGSV